MKVKLDVTLLSSKPPCFSYANDAVFMLITKVLGIQWPYTSGDFHLDSLVSYLELNSLTGY